MNSLLMTAHQSTTREITAMLELDESLFDLISGAGGAETMMMKKCGNCDSQVTSHPTPDGTSYEVDCVC